MKKRVLMIGPNVEEKGGVSSVAKQILNFNMKEKISMQYIETYVEDRVSKQLKVYIISIFGIFKKLLRENIDIVHIHMSYKGSFYRKSIIMNLCKLFKIKIIIHLHGSEFEKFYNESSWMVRKAVRFLFKRADCVLVLGEEWEKRILLIEPSTKTIILKNSIKISEKNSNQEEEVIKFLFLGTLIKRKGLYDLIDAIKILKDNQILENYKVKFIIGGVGPEEESIKSLIKDSDLSRYIDMAGWVTGDKKEKLLETSQVFVLPSYNEGLPVAILEAMSYGLPIISTRVGSIEEAVKDNINGYIINAGDELELSIKLKNLIEDRELRKQFSIQSKKIVMNNFNEENYKVELEKIYFSI